MPNRKLEERLKDDLTLTKLPIRPRLVFYLLHHVMDDTHRFKIGPSPGQPTVLRAAIFALCPKISDADLALDLQRLVDARVILLSDSERGWYGEITPGYRYQAADYEKGVPRYGPRAAAASTPVVMPAPSRQTELTLGPLGEVPRVPKPMKKSTPNDSDYGTENDTDCGGFAASSSDRRLESKVPKAQNRDLDLGKGAARGEGATKFAREPAEVLKTPLGMRLGRFLGMWQFGVEMRVSGAFWVKVIAERPEDLAELLEQGERIEGAERLGPETRAKFLMKRLIERAA